MSSQPALAAIGSLLIVDDSVVQRTQAVALCRELGVQMIYETASGAEALELLDMLVLPPDLALTTSVMSRALGQAARWNVGQGYQIAHPMPADELPRWLRCHQLRLPEMRAERGRVD
jgi:CheY-like chemotaxis protein